MIFMFKVIHFLLADVYMKFWNISLEIHELHLVHFHSAPGLAWQATFKKAKVKLDILTGNHMLLMLEKDIRVPICHFIHWYGKGNNKYI